MNKDDLILVSVDDHVVEPPDVFEKHLPAKYQEFAPKLKERDDGTLAWYYYEHEITNVGLNAVAGRPREEYGIEPTRLDEMRKGCWDVDERIKDMNAGGVLGSLCFPSMPGFSGRDLRLGQRRRHRRCDGEGVQRLARPRVVRQAPRPVHPARRADDLERGARRPRRCTASPTWAATPSRSPRTPSRSASRRCTIRTGIRSGGRARSAGRSSACTSARRRSWR